MANVGGEPDTGLGSNGHKTVLTRYPCGLVRPATTEDAMLAKQSMHIRLPARSASVDGGERVPGQPMPPPIIIDPRTASQNPVKPKEITF